MAFPGRFAHGFRVVTARRHLLAMPLLQRGWFRDIFAMVTEKK